MKHYHILPVKESCLSHFWSVAPFPHRDAGFHHHGMLLSCIGHIGSIEINWYLFNNFSGCFVHPQDTELLALGFRWILESENSHHRMHFLHKRYYTGFQNNTLIFARTKTAYFYMCWIIWLQHEDQKDNIIQIIKRIIFLR